MRALAIVVTACGASRPAPWNKGGLERSIDWRVVEAAEPYRLFGWAKLLAVRARRA